MLNLHGEKDDATDCSAENQLSQSCKHSEYANLLRKLLLLVII